MTVYYELDPNEPLTPEEIAEIEAIKDRPIEYDDDCPPITPEMARKFYRPGNDREGDMVSMRIQVTHDTLELAKKFGKDYVALMGELLDKAVAEHSAKLAIS